MILIDFRERIFPEVFENKNIPYQKKYLELGDFVFNNIVIERKTREDFEESIIDLRLFKQLEQLKKTFENVILIVEGERHEYRIKREAILGAYAAIVVDYKVPIFFTRDPEKTADLIYAIYKHVNKKKKTILPIFPKRKHLTPRESQIAILESLPNIGPRMARELLDYFGSPKGVFNADIEELSKVKGIGKKRAKIIYNIINNIYD